MKKVFIAIIQIGLSFFIINSYAQVNPTWSTSYSANFPINYDQSDLAADYAGNVYVSGSSNDTTYMHAAALLIKYNNYGGLEWARNIDSIGYRTKLVVDQSNNVYLAGTRGYDGDSIILMKYDPDGNRLWRKLYGTYIYWNQTMDLLINDSNYVILTGLTDYNHFTTQKYDSNGNLIWTAFDSTAHAISKSDIDLDDQYNIYLCARAFDTVNSVGVCRIYKYNNDGVKIWERDYQHYVGGCTSGLDIKVDNLGNVFTYSHVTPDCGAGTTAIAKYDVNGNFHWDTLIVGTAPNWQNKSSIDVDHHGNVYAIGTYGGSGPTDMYATIKIDSTGHQEWIRHYSLFGNALDMPYAIEVGDDGFIYMTGYSSDLNDDENFVTIKYDSLGNEVWVGRYHHTMTSNDYAHSLVINYQGHVFVSGQTIEFNSRGLLTLKYSHTIGIDEEDLIDLQVYPNPFVSSFMIESSVELNDAQLNVFDITGKIVLSIVEINGYSLTVPRNNLSSGMYFYTLTQNNKTIAKGKVIAD